MPSNASAEPRGMSWFSGPFGANPPAHVPRRVAELKTGLATVWQFASRPSRALQRAIRVSREAWDRGWVKSLSEIRMVSGGPAGQRVRGRRAASESIGHRGAFSGSRVAIPPAPTRTPPMPAGPTRTGTRTRARWPSGSPLESDRPSLHARAPISYANGSFQCAERLRDFFGAAGRALFAPPPSNGSCAVSLPAGRVDGA